MRQFISLALLALTVLSCDYFNSTRVCNKTSQDIDLILMFDSDQLTKDGRITPKEMTKMFHIWGHKRLQPVFLDTINFIGHYIINVDSCREIEGGNNKKPNFEYFKEIEVWTIDDTVSLRTKEEMIKAFRVDKERTSFYFDWQIGQDNK